MPPKCKFTREDVIQAAVEITREQGIAGVTARSLAARLGTSAKPIFGLFQNMEEVHSQVLNEANRLYQAYIAEDMEAGEYPPYKASGMAYIRFAREEKALFRLLFMRDRSGEVIPENREEIRPLLKLLQKNLGLDEEEAYRFHLQVWIYVHGVATMAATGYLDWGLEFISRTLTDVYQGLIHRYTGGNGNGSN